MSSNKFASLRYTASRLGLLIVSFAVVWVLCSLGVVPIAVHNSSNVIWMALLALVISAPLSFVLLRKQRDAMSEQIVERVDRAKERIAASASQEDAA